MRDQVEGMIRDSDIKWECRHLLKVIGIMQLPKELEQELIEPISRIVKIENERLDKLTKGSDLAASDRNATTDAANPPTLPTPTENTDIDEILDAYEIHRQDLHRSVQHLPKTREVQEEYLSRGKKIAKREILEVIKKTVLAELEDIYHTPGNTDAAWNRLCRRINELQATKGGK